LTYYFPFTFGVEMGMKLDLRAPRPAVVTRVLLTVVATLIALSVAGQASKYFFDHPQLKGFVPLFYVDYESNVPTWYSSFGLLSAAGLLALIAAVKTAGREPFRWHWWMLSLVFLGLSVDEVATFHEYPVDAMREAFQFTGALYYPWVIQGALFLLIVAAAAWRMVWSLPMRTRILFVAAAALFGGGALGVEMLSGIQASAHGEETFAYAMIVTVEEMCEMLGVVVFIHGLLDYIQREIGPVRLSIGQPALG
jgi:hypothetical protein